MSKLKKNTQQNLILDAQHHDPFAFLGFHQEALEKSNVKTYTLNCFLPYKTGVDVYTSNGWEPLNKTHNQGFFEWQGQEALNSPCKIRVHENEDTEETYDVYSFAPMITSN